jgi:hypothetical protein
MAYVRQWFRFSSSLNYRDLYDILGICLRIRIVWCENVKGESNRVGLMIHQSTRNVREINLEAIVMTAKVY